MSRGTYGSLSRGIALWLVLLAACGGPTPAVVPGGYAAHVGDHWFPFRADQLGIDEAAARARDAAISEVEPPELDAAMAVEVAALWEELCAKCHGLDGRGVEKPVFEREPKRWGGFGVRMGFFFGGDGMRAGIYKKIRDGGAPLEDGRASAMPPWGGVLSREQIWALVRHIEGL